MGVIDYCSVLVWQGGEAGKDFPPTFVRISIPITGASIEWLLVLLPRAFYLCY